ncbi:hypothetical protein Tco_1579158 [Tanacetum coccineum]
MSTPVIDLSPPKLAPSTTQAPLAARVTTIEQKFTAFEQKSKTLDNTTQNLGSRAPLRDRFRDLPEADMKEMLHQWMFETGSYKSLPEHVALYEALEASMERTQRDEKNKRHDSGASGSSQPPAPQSSAWKMIDTREAPSSSSKQQSGPYSEQPVEDIPMPDIANISDLEDSGSTHLPKIQPSPEWLKPILEEDRPATPEPA